MPHPKRLALAITLVCSLSLLCRAQETKDPETDAPPTSYAPVNGGGTAGKLAKFTSAADIADSVVTENTSKIGINVAPPTATLHVNGLQPGAVAAAGKDAATVLQTSGGKGGNTTGTTGQKAGAGASLSLVAGNGGDAPGGSNRGDGGSITLQPGSGGGGAGTAGVSGNVLLAPSGVGNVAIGANTATDKLTVKGVISSTTGGFKFPDGSIQTKAGLISVNTDSGLFGNGTADSPLGWEGIHIFSENPNQPSIYNPVADIVSNNPTQGAALHLKGFTGLRAEGNSSSGSSGVWGIANGPNGTGVKGDTQTGTGVYGYSSSTGNGTSGYSKSGYGVRGETASSTKSGVYGYSAFGDGVFGKSEAAAMACPGLPPARPESPASPSQAKASTGRVRAAQASSASAARATASRARAAAVMPATSSGRPNSQTTWR